MSNILAERVEKPHHFRIGPLIRGRGKRKLQVIGFDSEASGGKPFLFQFSVSGGEEDVLLCVIDERENAGLRTFVHFLDTYCTRKDTEYLIFGWNLAYEWTQIFPDLPATAEGIPLNALPDYTFDTERRDDNGDPYSRWRVKVLNDKRYMATFTHAGTKRRVRLIDGMSYYVTGLDKAGEMLALGRKITLGKDEKKHLTRAALRDPRFMQYARQDAYLTRRIGEQIMGLHETYDVPTCGTAPQFAARVFRHHFLNVVIPPPSADLEQAGLFSYHGGKNGYYLDGPRHLTGVYAFDIVSAYPEAMRALPNIETAVWEYRTSYMPAVHALYKVTMRYKPCVYRGAQAHDGRKLDAEYVDGVWITSYELDAILAHGEAELIACEGWQLTGEPGGPLVAYVDRFFAEKRATKGAARAAAKLLLLSLYGKFFQKVAQGAVGLWEIDIWGHDTEPVRLEHDPNSPYDWTAGGLYHPPLASLITGFVRGKIHRLEHKYRAVMTSTDGFFARTKPDPADMGTDLGQLEAPRGDLSIWRERLYIFTPKGEKDPAKRKVALHGFRGDADALARIPLVPGDYEYTAQQLITNRLAGRQFRDAEGVRRAFGAGVIPELKYVLAVAGQPP